MPSKPRTSLSFPAEVLLEWRQDTVTRLLDDVNVLAEALVAAMNEKDDVRTASIRISLDRYALAMSWSKDQFLPAIVAYVNERPELDIDLFAPTFILKSIAPEHPETATLLAKVSQDVRDLLARLCLLTSPVGAPLDAGVLVP
jgi:hypothetical protein